MYDDTIEGALKGKTLQVYLYLLKRDEPVGVRDIQRDLNFSSPSVASYHLEKLMALNLVAKDEYGRYYITRKAEIGLLESFVRVLGYTIPRLTFFAIFFTTLLVTYIVINNSSLNIHALIFAVIASIAFWFETIRLWRRRPF